MIAVALAMVAVLIALATIHIYADQFAPKPVILEKRTDRPENGSVHPAKGAGGPIRTLNGTTTTHCQLKAAASYGCV
jgi:hypothetical protein